MRSRRSIRWRSGYLSGTLQVNLDDSGVYSRCRKDFDICRFSFVISEGACRLRKMTARLLVYSYNARQSRKNRHWASTAIL
jgi:hypothetical protein